MRLCLIIRTKKNQSCCDFGRSNIHERLKIQVALINDKWKKCTKKMFPKEWGNFKLLAIIIGDIVPSACPSTTAGLGTCNPLL
jgi:hypothetical protein